MTLRELFISGTDILEDAGIDDSSVDAFCLLEYLTGITRAGYLMDMNRSITDDSVSSYMELIERRASHIPCQYITGYADFAGLKFRVTPDVLIPRLDSEVLLEEALRLITKDSKVLDVCTGSGCLAVSIKHYRPDVSVTASDISAEALAIACENADRILENGDIIFKQGDLFECIPNDELFDLIISNPPYVTEEEYKDLMSEVRDHEPKLALTAGSDGLDILRRMIPEATAHLTAGGHLAVETGYLQGETVRELMEQAGFGQVKIIKDLAGLDRVVSGRYLKENAGENSYV